MIITEIANIIHIITNKDERAGSFGQTKLRFRKTLRCIVIRRHLLREDLAMLIKFAECRAEQQVLDVGAGAGHTMLAFAPYVQECIGIDATQGMVDVASSFAEEKAAANIYTLSERDSV
jgi:ubiquinone/menaquinone biosynthesis C-methylase UbiE